MYINPLHAIQEGWIKFPEWMDEEFKQKCIQPNAIDITLDHAYTLGLQTRFCLSETSKQMRSTERQNMHSYFSISDEPFFTLHTGSTDIMSDFFVTVPAGVAAFLIVRSTLNRNGLWVTSGLYDQGFSNNIGFVIHNDGPNAFIAPHTRVAQLVFVKSEDSGLLYNGTYNQNQGQHWSNIDQEVIENDIIREGLVDLSSNKPSSDDVEVIDFTLPPKDEMKGTLVETLPGSELADLEYFQSKK
ncbi:MAG: hypothetical protein EO766_12040 [Hydrotalea sp. AMD]|uniref:dCTP deaminase domain-containing protein n=1 Tax=Hydrotalea sp. AMD TaxID=2501297 RepID=UPI0010271C05|nr:hypothetical protein [Hydrotalea sp. AMD]RWZ87249.1 MAG: hypothetical protein EO766_12040 [Hydrotalea sp. AMD]